jgi:hypothetical protein
MAASYITNVQITGKLNLPCGGKTINGVPKQGKIWITGYTAGTYQNNGAGGTFLLPNVMQLETVDLAIFEPQSINAIEPSETAQLGVQWKRTTNQLYLFSAVDGATEAGNGVAYVLRFAAFGDTAASAELL